MLDFVKPIQSVCYIEHYGKNFKPYLMLATPESIELMGFMKRENIHDRNTTKIISKLNFDLIKLVKSEFDPIILELEEVVTKIFQQ